MFCGQIRQITRPHRFRCAGNQRKLTGIEWAVLRNLPIKRSKTPSRRWGARDAQDAFVPGCTTALIRRSARARALERANFGPVSGLDRPLIKIEQKRVARSVDPWASGSASAAVAAASGLSCVWK